MYRVALGAMGAILGVQVEQTLGFHKMEISTVDAVD